MARSGQLIRLLSLTQVWEGISVFLCTTPIMICCEWGTFWTSLAVLPGVFVQLLFLSHHHSPPPLPSQPPAGALRLGLAEVSS